MKYRKKPVVIEAFLLGSEEKPKWAQQAFLDGRLRMGPTGQYVYVDTLEGRMRAERGLDYIIQGVDGELYPCKKDIFEKTYELAES